MVVRHLLLCFMNVALTLTACEGFHSRDAGEVGHHALEELSTSIFEKIKLATGYPMNRDPFRRSLRMVGKYRPRQEGGNSGKSSPRSREKWDVSHGKNSDEFTKDYYSEAEGNMGKKSRGGHKSDRSFLAKGYEYVHRRDETKGSDSFWDNQQTEGKWFKHGGKMKMESKGKESRKGEERGKAESRKEERKNAKSEEEEPEGANREKSEAEET